MNDDATKWVTIKIPKEVRDEARPDPRTYGDIMLDGLEAGDDTTAPDVDSEKLAEVIEFQEKTIEELRAQRDLLENALKKSVSLNAAERRRIAEEVAEVLQR